MANTKQAQKYIRKTATRTEHTRAVRSRLRTLGKKLKAVADKPEEAKQVAAEYSAALDKAAKRNIIHTNNANRNKAKISKFLFAEAK